MMHNPNGMYRYSGLSNLVGFDSAYCNETAAPTRNINIMNLLESAFIFRETGKASALT